MISPANPSIQDILDKAVAGERITPEEGVKLLESSDLVSLGKAADAISRRLHPEPYRTYNIDRNINYTNVCTAVCDFCAFYRPPNHPDVYVLSQDVLHEKIRETIALGGDQILLQGGLHPKLPLEWYEEMLSNIKAEFPNLNIHGFSPPEIYHFTKISKLPLKTVLERLKAAGLGSLPGGGGEILVDRVRKEITRGKVLTDDWLEVNRVWHQLGGRSSATMMFGHVETAAERIEHLARLRDLQDETGGFTAFACWTMQPDGVPQEEIYPERATPGVYLRVQALSRIFLDNFKNIQTSYVTQGVKMATVTLRYGCNDFGGTMLEENVVSAAGCFHLESVQRIEDAIARAGFTPRQRNSWYGISDERHEGEGAPRTAQEASCEITAGGAA